MPTLPTRTSPDYSIDALYSNKVDGWIANFPNATPQTISFKVSDASSDTWSQYGFESQSVSASTSAWIFFSATYTENSETKTEYVSASEAADEVDITVSMSGFGQFPISAGAW